jgi:hypothetical protein
MKLRTWCFSIVLAAGGSMAAFASDIFVAQSAVGADTGFDCGSAHSYTFFNTEGNWGTGSGKIGPGTTVHVCGTIIGTAGGTGLSFQGNGASGNPITLLFEANAVLQAPFWAPSLGGSPAGAITFGVGRSWLTIDGGANGIVQNTANGSGLANHVPSTGVSGFNCSSCTVRNLTIANLYVNLSGSGTLGDNSVVRAIDFNGPNWSIHDNTIHDCGWCVFDGYQDGDTHTEIFNNNIYNMGHAIAYAASTSNGCSSPCLLLHDNHIHDAANWSAPGCPFHQDGLHTFGTTGSSIADLYISNNLFDGDWGVCPTGFIFLEGGTVSPPQTPSHLKSFAIWNNVFVVVNSGIVNTNGWISIATGESGTQRIMNNTVLGANATDNTACFVLQNLSGLIFENNTVSPCGSPVRVDSSVLVAVDHNFYGPSCTNGGNCFVWNGSFSGSFSKWKTNCACDINSVQNNTPLLNSDGSLQTNSPASTVGLNLMASATGNLASLASDTSKGNTRQVVARPFSGSWAAGAYASGSGTITVVNPPLQTPPTNIK